MTTEGSEPDDGEITPIDFQPSQPRDVADGRRWLRPTRVAIGIGAAVLGVLVWFSLTAVSVQIHVEPEVGVAMLTPPPVGLLFQSITPPGVRPRSNA